MVKQTLDFFLLSGFLGFAIWTIIWTYGKSKGWKIHYEVDDIDVVAVKTIIFLGIIYFTWLALNFQQSDRMFGKYWFGVWTYYITYILLPQLFWFHKARNSKILRILVAFWILILLLVEKIIIIVTSFHRDYSDVGLGSYFWLSTMLNLLVSISTFTIIVLTLTALLKKWKVPKTL